MKRDINLNSISICEDTYWRLNVGSSIVLLDREEAIKLLNVVMRKENEIFRGEEKNDWRGKEKN